jgi:hypothetical protein
MIATAEDLSKTAKALRDELAATRLVVVLAPAKRGSACVRVVESQNPEWYRRLCSQHGSARRDLRRWRKHKTAIRRRETLRALERIAAGETRGVYVERLLPVIQSNPTPRPRPKIVRYSLMARRSA